MKFSSKKDIKDMSLLQIIGLYLLVSGIVLWGVVLYMSLQHFDAMVAGNPLGMKHLANREATFAAIAFYSIMLSIIFIFPETLMGGRNDTVSTMRVAVFMIVSVFVFLCVKQFWQIDNVSDFKLDSTWGYVITAALGSKAVQSIGENIAFKKPAAANKGPHDGQAGAEPPAS